MTHADSINVGEPAMPATSDGVWKMPAPITMPTVIMVASKTLKVGVGTSRAVSGVAIPSDARSPSRVMLMREGLTTRTDVRRGRVVAGDLRFDAIALQLSLQPRVH